MTHPDQTYTAEQAAKELGVPAPTIRRWHRNQAAMRQGHLPSRGRNGSIALFTLAELEPLAAAYHARKSSRTKRDTPPND